MNKLTYERAKLLYTPYDVDQLRHLCALRDVEIDRLRADSAKLRKAVEYLYGFANTCGVDANDLRELGVEL